jgi:hypothetical protein
MAVAMFSSQAFPDLAVIERKESSLEDAVDTKAGEESK